MAELVVRQADVGDIDAIAKLEKICFSDPWSREAVREEIEDNPLAMYIVGEVDGKVIGYVGVWWIFDEGHITNVAVAPEYRRMYAGQAIVGTMINFGRKEGLKSFTLEVRVSNEPAIKLYKGFGFKEAGIRPKYYSDNEDAMIMWLTEE